MLPDNGIKGDPARKRSSTSVCGGNLVDEYAASAMLPCDKVLVLCAADDQRQVRAS